MAVHYMAGDRPPLESDNWRHATDEERLAAVRTYGGYSGRYTWLGDRVEHHVDASINPSWVGTTLVRLVDLDGADIVLHVGSGDPDEPPTPVLRWRRRRT
jgi:lipocalin-like protein